MLFPVLLGGAIAVKLRWLFPPVFFLLTYWHTDSFAVALFSSALASLFFYFLLVESFVEFGVFLPMVSVNPVRWLRDPMSPARISASKRLSWLHLLSANAIASYFLLFFAGLAIAKLAGLASGNAYTIAFCVVWSMILRTSYLWLNGIAAAKLKVLLLRKFDEDVSRFVKEGLVPMIGAFGSMKTPHDKSLDDAQDVINEEGVPVGCVDVICIPSGDWKATVAQLIERTDIVVADVSEPTPSLAWELAEVAKMQKPLVLTASLGFLVDHQNSLIESLSQELIKVYGRDEAANAIRNWESPIPYGKTLVVNSFCSYMFLRRLRQMTQT